MMPEITRSRDCGNSPKNQFVEDVSVALNTADVQAVLEWVTDDVVWQIIGGAKSSGKSDLAEAIQRFRNRKVAALTVEHVATHGRTGAVSGHVQFENGSRQFCDVYEFSNTRGTHVKAIKSFRVDEGE